MMNSEDIRMVYCHIELIAATVASLKPKNILELGYGSGKSAKAILAAIQKYKLGDTLYTIVDNWQDHDGVCPKDLWGLHSDYGFDYQGVQHFPLIKLITSTEEKFVSNIISKTWQEADETFDLIVSDADHGNSWRWFDKVYYLMLRPGGIGFFHDVNSNDWNLKENVTYCRAHKI